MIIIQIINVQSKFWCILKGLQWVDHLGCLCKADATRCRQLLVLVVVLQYGIGMVCKINNVVPSDDLTLLLNMVHL